MSYHIILLKKPHQEITDNITVIRIVYTQIFMFIRTLLWRLVAITKIVDPCYANRLTALRRMHDFYPRFLPQICAKGFVVVPSSQYIDRRFVNINIVTLILSSYRRWTVDMFVDMSQRHILDCKWLGNIIQWQLSIIYRTDAIGFKLKMSSTYI